MKTFLKTLALATLLMASASPARAQISFGIQIGQPPADRAYRVPRQPGPDYDWIEGYWYPDGARYKWHNGYWTRPPYPEAYWIAPYYNGGRYYPGEWQSSRGNTAHDHRSDRRRQRDQGRDSDRDTRGRRDNRNGEPGSRNDGRR